MAGVYAQAAEQGSQLFTAKVITDFRRKCRDVKAEFSYWALPHVVKIKE